MLRMPATSTLIVQLYLGPEPLLFVIVAVLAYNFMVRLRDAADHIA